MEKKLLLPIILCYCFFASAQQNTILIIADDTRTDYFGFSEDAQDTANVPNIRSLLQNGIRFKRAWASPVCSPTRSGIITGRYPFRTGVGYVITNAASPQLDTSEMSVARLLHDYAPLKYKTACVGKWHLNNYQPSKLNYPNLMGFDLYSGNFNGALTDYYNYVRVKNGVVDTVTIYATTQTVNDAIGWLDTIGNLQPFFLWLAFNAAHSPYHKPPDSLHTVQGLTGTVQHINMFPELYFKAAIEAMDTEIGRLMQWLTVHNISDSTNIIFIGDNGNDINVAQVPNPAHSKGTLYEYGVHVPFIISGPAVSTPGVSSALVSTPDLFATMLDMCGFTNWFPFIPAARLPVDAVSLSPILQNQTTTLRNYIFTEQFQTTANPNDGKTIRNTDFKLIRFDNGSEEFYNISSDTVEQNNLLTTTLNTIQTANYNYLCSQLDSLLSTNYCVLTIPSVPVDNKISVCPTFFTDKIQINSEGVFTCYLNDTNGKTILTGIGCNHTQLNTQTLTHGIYFISVKTASANAHFKLIK